MLDETTALVWGKAHPDVPGGYHPALLHMIDVGAVALCYIRRVMSQAVKERLFPASQRLREEHIALFVACHDIGKVSPGFQIKIPERFEHLEARGLPKPKSRLEGDHGVVTHLTLTDLLEDLGVDEDVAWSIARSVGAHHGRVPLDLSEKRRGHMGGEAWDELRQSHFESLCETFEVYDLDSITEELSDHWYVLLAGFTSICDWLGSDTDYFPYNVVERDLPSYLVASLKRAEVILSEQGFTGWRGGEHALSFPELFDGWSPNPLQSCSESHATGDHLPSLMIIEAPTGVGKTEAALVVAEQWITRDLLAGMYVALPTQATSNQMMKRITQYLDRRYGDQRVNLHLMHGLSSLQESYRALKMRSIDSQGDSVHGVVADGWFRGNKRCLIAPFAVGTVDQIMTATLEVKHFFVRLFGLAGRVIVIDEVHAYDPFMNTILDELLGWLNVIGARVILLSATLPQRRRDELLTAWDATITPSQSVGYPRVTSAGSTQAITEYVDAGRTLSPTLEWCTPSTDHIANLLKERLVDGGCVAWICNTVNGAQRAYEAAISAGWCEDEVLVFHARFTIGQRVNIERVVLDTFGKDVERPHRRLLISTQVVEQSLDLDFDLMLTELSPIDLLIQRAGRLHRHQRDARPSAVALPHLMIVQPEVRGDGAYDFGVSQYIYSEHLLLRTYLTLAERTAWHIPSDLDELVESVYREESPSHTLSEAITRQWIESAKDLEARRRRAAALPLDTLVMRSVFVEGDSRALGDIDDVSDLHDTQIAKTRDIGETVQIACLLPKDHDLCSQDEISYREAKHLLMCSLNLSNRRWVNQLKPIKTPLAWRRHSISAHLRPVCFDVDRRAVFDKHVLVLDSKLGLIFSTQS